MTYNTPGTYTATLIVSNANGTSTPTSVDITVLPQQICQVNLDFESTAINQLPNGWSHNGTGSVSFVVEDNVTVTTTTGTANTSSHQGSKAIYGNENWDGAGPIPIRLTTAAIDLNGLVNPRINYWDLRGWDDAWPAPKPEHTIEIQVSTSPNGPWSALATDTTLQSEALTWRRVGDLDLSAYAGQIIYLSFFTDTHHYYWRIDDICVASDPLINIDAELEDAPLYTLDGHRLRVHGDHFCLYDLQGKLLAEGTEQQILDTSPLANGIYALVIRRNEQLLSTKIYLSKR